MNDIGWTEATLVPRAECQECAWHRQPASVVDCRRHVTESGHCVLRIKETRAAYYRREAKSDA